MLARLRLFRVNKVCHQVSYAAAYTGDLSPELLVALSLGQSLNGCKT